MKLRAGVSRPAVRGLLVQLSRRRDDDYGGLAVVDLGGHPHGSTRSRHQPDDATSASAVDTTALPEASTDGLANCQRFQRWKVGQTAAAVAAAARRGAAQVRPL
jgi:hypothetical protein